MNILGIILVGLGIMSLSVTTYEGKVRLSEVIMCIPEFLVIGYGSLLVLVGWML
jgi:hypothetical protein